MLSVLIPVYNFDIRNLVAELARQCAGASICFEILALDDGSELQFKYANRELAGLPNVIYEELPRNVGRAAIRNLLADKAQFEWLLFLDCDSDIIRQDFIHKYLNCLSAMAVVYGGTFYTAEQPKTQFRLHWKYGKFREALPVAARRKSPFLSFKTNNFLAPKSIFVAIRFDEKLKFYGHEDSLFAAELKKKGVQIQHLDNPVAHLGLEPSPVFLEKTRLAIQNLSHFGLFPGFRQTKLVKAALLVEKLGLSEILLFVFEKLEKQLLNQLNLPNPSLLLFNFYKLGYLVKMLRLNKNPPVKKF